MSVEDEAAKVRDRITFFQKIADDLFASGAFGKDRVVLRSAHIDVLTNGYFILNECYKAWRIKEGHYTQLPKIAALQTISIMMFQPFRPIHTAGASTLQDAKCNEIFALSCAYAALGLGANSDAIDLKEDFVLRLLDVFTALECQTLEPYRIDVNMQITRDNREYFRTIHDVDKPGIDSLICIFELLANKFGAKPSGF